MSVNRYKPHIFVLPEDDANREIAVGFLLHPSILNPRQVQVMPNAGGWPNALDKLQAEYIRLLSNIGSEENGTRITQGPHAERLAPPPATECYFAFS
jgi:hypothetical protein